MLSGVLFITCSFQFEHDVFYSAQSITVGPNEQKTFEVYFEPNAVGKILSKLTLNCSVLGQYV